MLGLRFLAAVLVLTGCVPAPTLQQSSQPSAATPAARDIDGESCDEVAANYGRLLNARLMAVLPNGDRAAAVATTLTLTADEHLRAAGLAGQCSYAEFAVTAIETLTPDLDTPGL